MVTDSDPKVYTPPKKDIPIHVEAVTMECGAAISRGQMEQFVRSFQQSARRWEIVVYPAMFAFALLAAYGFFLIYSLTSDMTKMARSIDPDMGDHMRTMAHSIKAMSTQIELMAGTMTEISVKLDTLPPMLQHMGYMEQAMVRMDGSITRMDKSIRSMDESMARMDTSMTTMNKAMTRMNEAMQTMTSSTDQMRRDMMVMSRGINNFSRPMGFMNNNVPIPW
jgi:hypothetical protein